MKVIYKYLPVALLALTSCTDWSDHYDDAAAAAGSGATLWQTMQQRPELSDFCEVLGSTEVFRMHRKTGVSYASLLDGGQSFTVLAPVNGTFNRDSLIALTATARGDSAVEQHFVANHLSRSTTSAFATEQDMRLANTKRISIDGGRVGDVPITEANVPARNGVLHVVGAAVPYGLNLYEAMKDLPQFGDIGRFLSLYEEDEFDEDASLSSGMVDGVPVYVDSVVVERNRMLESIGLLNAEDSTYWMVAPTADGWQKALQEASSYFVYDATVEKSDSISAHWTYRALLDDAIYNMTLQSSPADSLVSVQYQKRYPEYHVFRKPFEPGGVLADVEQTIKCSNGVLYQTREWPFRPEETYFRVLKSEAEDEALIIASTLCSYNTRSLSADSISEGGYLDIVPETSTSQWTMTFNVANTLAGTYDVCAVVLPKSVYNPLSPDLRPCKFRAAVNYVDADGKAQTYNCGNTTYITDPERTDTVVLARGFRFPVCNYDQTNTKISVKLTCNILARETSQYAREMYLDCIYLRPSSNNEEQ